MRATKVCSLGFGLVSVPVKVYKATESHDIGMHRHHKDCNGAVGQRLYCKECGELVEFGDIISGVEHDGQLVILTPEEKAGVEGEVGKDIEVLQFVDADEVDPILYEQPYYLEPDGKVDGYALLRQVLVESNRVGIVQFVMRTRSTLGVLRVLGNVLVIETMRWIDEVRNANELKGMEQEVKLDPKALTMAHALVESMASEFNPAEFKDLYTERLGELIAAKAGESEFITKPKELDEPVVDDLIAALEASVARHPAGKARGKKAAPKRPARKTA